LCGHTHTIRWVTYSPTGSRIASCSEDGKIRIWHAVTGDFLHEISVPGKYQVHCIVFSPDEKWLAAGSSDETIQIWDVEAAYALDCSFKGPGGEVYSVAWSPNGVLLACGSERSIFLWNNKSKVPIYNLKGHSSPITSIAFSPDSLKLASASWDKTIRLWDTRTGQCIGQPLEGHEGSINSVAFSPDGRYMASGSEDKTIHIWTMRQPRKIEFRPPPLLSSIVTLESSDTPSSSPSENPKANISYIDDDGWARTLTGQRVIWVPIPHGNITVESEKLVVEGHGREWLYLVPDEFQIS
jgi:uncharacterized protein with WD repeat